MQFQITYIEFDTDDDDIMTAYDKDELNCEYIGTIWDADDEDDLVEEITVQQVGVSNLLIIVTFLTLTETQNDFY